MKKWTTRLPSREGYYFAESPQIGAVMYDPEVVKVTYSGLHDRYYMEYNGRRVPVEQSPFQWYWGPFMKPASSPWEDSRTKVQA